MTSSFQYGRLLQLSTPLAEDELLPIKFAAQEFLCHHFKVGLEMVSSTLNIDPKSVLNKAFSVTLYTGDSQPLRYFHGLVSFFEGHSIDNQLRHYQAQLRPWLWFLNYRVNSRIFQNKNVPDIVEQIFQEAGFRDYDFSGINRGQYQQRDYCVQYRESDYNFVQRLFEDEGIFYFFRHEQNKHTLVLGDQNSVFKLMTPSQVQFDAGSNRDYCLNAWLQSNQIYSGKVTHQDYNFETPDTSLTAQQSSGAKLYAAQQYEAYHYPGGHSTTSAGNTRAQHQFEAHEAGYNVYRGNGGYPQFTAGGQFSFAEPPSAGDAGNYILLNVSHFATEGSYLHGVSGQQAYHNSFSCIPAKVPFRPLQLTQKPIIPSIQTALVVGSAGEEIDTDEYGRVKVQFHWDRQGQKNEDSSCWIRVAQLWAGNQWGMHFMPRIGQEVVVQFIDGDPDRPLIVGCVYNENNKTPYSLPSSQTQSGIKTRSTKGGGSDDFNELRFEDKHGAEEVFIQAQKDFTQNIKNNLNLTIGNDHNLSTTNNSNIKAGKNLLHSAQGEAAISAGKDLTQSAGDSANLTAGSNLNQSAGNDLTQSAGKNLNQTVGTDATVSVGNDLGHFISNNLNQSVGNNYTQMIRNNLITNIGSSGIIEAGQSIILRVGENSISISSTGILINGVLVKVNSV